MDDAVERSLPGRGRLYPGRCNRRSACRPRNPVAFTGARIARRLIAGVAPNPAWSHCLVQAFQCSGFVPFPGDVGVKDFAFVVESSP